MSSSSIVLLHQSNLAVRTPAQVERADASNYLSYLGRQELTGVSRARKARRPARVLPLPGGFGYIKGHSPPGWRCRQGSQRPDLPADGRVNADAVAGWPTCPTPAYDHPFLNRDGGPLSERWGRKLVVKYRSHAGIAKRAGCHSLRHTFANL